MINKFISRFVVVVFSLFNEQPFMSRMCPHVHRCFGLPVIAATGKRCLSVCCLQTPVIQALGVALHDADVFTEPDTSVNLHSFVFLKSMSK